jgi:phosphopantetheinyl transferase
MLCATSHAVEIGVGIEVTSPDEHPHMLLEVIKLGGSKEVLHMPPMNRCETSHLAG